MHHHLFLAFAFSAAAAASVVEVKSSGELRHALAMVADGDTIKIHPGDYAPGNWVKGVSDLTVEAADPDNPPHFKGGGQAWHFSRCPNLTLRNLRCSGQSANGINLDDGGPKLGFVAGTTLENLHISDVGPVGNFDGIKCSGLSDMSIRGCEISGWGGQAIDLVGCRRIVISKCRFTGKHGFSQHTGPQFKGGCEDVTVEDCVFVNAGQRPVQAGGSTGLDFFRPLGVKYEARRIHIRRNRIEGGDCACTFTGVDGAEFADNTILRPKKWIFRILSETREEGFKPTQNVRITGNTIIYRTDQIQTAVNIGTHTAPETFTFADNRWYAEDKPEASRPQLPVEETGGIYGVKLAEPE